MQKRKISTKIALIVSTVVIVSVTFLFCIVDRNLTRSLERQVSEDMGIIARDRAELIETYIEGCCDFLSSYSKASEIKSVLENPNSSTIKAAQEYTNKCTQGKDRMEGLYVAEWDTYVLAHLNPDSINKNFRDKESAKALENQIKSEGKAFCTGIVLAPITKKMVIPVYAPVYGSNGEATGFAGAAFHTDELADKLIKLKNENTPNSTYLLINGNNNVFIFHNQNDFVGTECSDKETLSIMKNYRKFAGKRGRYIYSGDDIIASC